MFVCLLLKLLWRLFRSNKNNVISRLADNKQSVRAEFSAATSPPAALSNEDIKATPEGLLNFTLLQVSDLGSEQRLKLVQMTKSLRKPHPLLLPLISCGSEANELFELVKTDPEMSAKILTAVNSPLYGVTQPITNINHAIKFMGVHQVKNIALELCVKNNAAEFSDSKQNAAYQKLWSVSQLASALCALIAKNLDEENVGELATCCLLSYLGDHAILAFKPAMAEQYLNVSSMYRRTEFIQKNIGVNAAVVGEIMAQQWQLPKVIDKGIAYSLLPVKKISVNVAFAEPYLKNAVLCYIACRLAEFIIFKEIHDIGTISPLNSASVSEGDFLYIEHNIEQVGLERIHAVMADPLFRQQENKLIS